MECRIHLESSFPCQLRGYYEDMSMDICHVLPLSCVAFTAKVIIIVVPFRGILAKTGPAYGICERECPFFNGGIMNITTVVWLLTITFSGTDVNLINNHEYASAEACVTAGREIGGRAYKAGNGLYTFTLSCEPLTIEEGIGI